MKPRHALLLLMCVSFSLPLLSPAAHAQETGPAVESDLKSEDTPPPEPPFDKPREESAPIQRMPSPEAQSETKSDPISPDKPVEMDDTKTRYIHHPQSKQGLMRITNDGKYLYRVKPSPQSRAGGFSVGTFMPPAIENPTTHATWKNIYGNSPNIILLASYEKQFSRRFGKLGWRAGSGLLYAQGNGRLEITNQLSREKFTMFLFPNNAALIYRAQYWDRQILIPYGEGGGDYFTMIETRNDKKPPRFGGALAAHLAGGIALSLNGLDRMMASRLDQEYGITTVYFTAEYRHIIGLSSTFDFTSDIVTGGFLFEF